MADMDQDQLFGTSIGERLKAAREEKKMALEDVARQTRIPIRHLEHIERGEWDALPAITYSVGFARSYALAVGLDGPAIGAEVRALLGGAPRNQAVPPAYYEPADPSRVPPRSIALIAAAIAAILIILYLVWRSNAVDDPGVDESQIVEATAPSPAPAAQSPRGSAGGPASAAASGPVVITATVEVWLRIYEAGGKKLFEGTMKPGQRYEVPASANAPQILTGRPNAIQVSVGATQIPALGQPEKTIADVSLKPADLLGRLQGPARPGFDAQPPAE
jgi:cytoskeletal protein RodZ